MRENIPHPDGLRFSIGGYCGTSHLVELRDGELWHEFSPRGDANWVRLRLRRPTAAQWSHFWQSMEQIDAWAWKPEYRTPGVLDGTGWSLELTHDTRRAISHGDNGYPGGVETEYAEDSVFARLLRELEKLTGIKGIR